MFFTIILNFYGFRPIQALKTNFPKVLNFWKVQAEATGQILGIKIPANKPARMTNGGGILV